MNLLNEVTNGESPPSQMGRAGRGGAEQSSAGQKARREERRGEGARAGEGGR